MVMPRRLHQYVIEGGGVDVDGWWRYRLTRDDGKTTKATKSRVAELRRKGQIVERNSQRK